MGKVAYPLCLVEIYGQNESFILEGNVGIGRNPTSDLISVSTHKSLSPESPAGVFDLTLVHSRDAQGRTWLDKVMPQDTVVLQMSNCHGEIDPNTGAGQLHTVMIGFVDTVTKQTAVTSAGKLQRAIRIRGRDAGKLFIHGMVTYWSFLGASIVGAAQFVDLYQFNDKPNRVIRVLLEQLYQRMMHLQMLVNGSTVDFFDLLAYRLQSYDVEIPAGLDYQFTGGEGTFWSFFVKCASLPFHELWIDTRRTGEALEGVEIESQTPKITLGRDQSAPTLFLRPTPFPYLSPPGPREQAQVEKLPVVEGDLVTLFARAPVTSSRLHMENWNALQRHIVGRDDLTGEPFDEEISRSAEEQPNMYLVFPEYSWIGKDIYLLNVPAIIDVAKFRRYGYRPMTPRCTLLKIGANDTPEDPMIGFYTSLAWRMATWNCLNDQFLSGTKAFRLLPHVHVGERLVDASDWQVPVEYYIESVKHTFIQNERAVTHLGLTRGLPVNDADHYYPTLLRNARLTSAVGPGIRDRFKELLQSKPPASVGGL